MEDANTILRWRRAETIAQRYGISIKLVGDSFELCKPSGLRLGMVHTVTELLSFLLGYDWGRSTIDRIQG